ncbi:MAG: manganese catalase family protein, partial [Bacteroidetes bacterium]|nr:manganese catalase family protein [Bacteroidota bacterium]
MTREVAHYQQFEAALSTIQPNFPPGILQSDPRYSNLYFNMSDGAEVRGPWNEGQSTQLREEWQCIREPIECIRETQGLQDMECEGTDRTEETVQQMDRQLREERSREINEAVPTGENQWSEY